MLFFFLKLAPDSSCPHGRFVCARAGSLCPNATEAQKNVCASACKAFCAERLPEIWQSQGARLALRFYILPSAFAAVPGSPACACAAESFLYPGPAPSYELDSALLALAENSAEALGCALAAAAGDAFIPAASPGAACGAFLGAEEPLESAAARAIGLTLAASEKSALAAQGGAAAPSAAPSRSI